jgi:hypothetical protein
LVSAESAACPIIDVISLDFGEVAGILNRAFCRASRRRRVGYTTRVLFDGETVVDNSTDPEHDLARALLARGVWYWLLPRSALCPEAGQHPYRRCVP